MTRAVLLVLLVAGCATEEVLQPPDPSLNRMILQPRYEAYGESRFFPDGRAMREPPPGTIPRQTPVGRPVRTRRFDPNPTGGSPPVDRALLETGRRSFERFCAACHGIAGDGVSIPAMAMELVPAPSLHIDRVVMMPDAHVFEVVTNGWGLMPAFDGQLDVPDRWAVVAYLRALQISRRVQVESLPEVDRRRLEEAGP